MHAHVQEGRRVRNMVLKVYVYCVTWMTCCLVYTAHIYIYKEKCRTVVRELLPRALTNRDQTFPAVEHCTAPRSKGVGVRE